MREGFIRAAFLSLLFFAPKVFSVDFIMRQEIFDASGKDYFIQIERVKDLKGEHQELALYSLDEKRLDVFSTDLNYLTLYQLGEGGDLVTVWGGGSGYEIILFSIADDRMVKKISEGSKYFPEFIRLSPEDDLSILIVHTQVVSTGNRLSAVLYSPCDKTYIKMGEFLAEKKFSLLKKNNACKS